MIQEEDYASDSDQSDEDFCPEKEAGDTDAVSEEDSDDDISDAEETTGTEKEKQEITRKKTLKKEEKSKKSLKKLDRVEKDRTNDTESCRRTTRQNDGNCNGRETIEKDRIESDDEEKSKTDALWSDFLSDVKPVTTRHKTNKTDSSLPTKSNTNGNGAEKIIDKLSEKSVKEKSIQKTTTVTEIMDFAGEEVRVKKVIKADNIKHNHGHSTSATTASNPRASSTSLKRPTPAGGGLGSILNQIGKKKKLSVLEKTKLDWNAFKQNEGIEEDLQTHNKGKDGYLERQDFLQRTDSRQFEIEKTLRQTRRKN